MNDIQNEMMAQRFHEAYERLAPTFGYETRKESAKPWAGVPANNKRLMAAVCAEVFAPFYVRIRSLEADLSHMQDELDEAKDVIRYGGTWTPNKSNK
jgi:hypothetical protein